MFYAKAMYLGSEIPVCAEDENLDYYSYRLLGLRCIVCGEEVQFRKGYVNRPHFAHFQETGINQNKCELRVTGYSSSWSSLTSEGKGQRRKLFQEHFINIIKRQDISFDNNIQILKAQLFSNSLKEITNKCRIYFDSKKEDLIRECRQFNTGMNDSNNWIHGLIASEAIDYLSIPTSRYPLEVLLHYSIYIACDQSKSNNWNIFISTIEPNSICQILKEVILKTNWLMSFGNLYNYKKFIDLGDSTRNHQNVNVKLAQDIEKYIDLDSNGLEFNNDNHTKFKLKLSDLNINLFSFQEVANLTGFPARKAYRYYKTVGKIIDIDEGKNNEVFIIYKLIYDGSISNIISYENLHKKILWLLVTKKKNPYLKITFTLANWEEIVKFSNEDKRIKEEEQQRIAAEKKRRAAEENMRKKELKKQRKQQLEIIITEIKNISKSQDSLIINTKMVSIMKSIIQQIRVIGDPEDPAVRIASKVFALVTENNKNRNQKIECPICKTIIRKENFFRHLKTIHIDYDNCKYKSIKLIEMLSDFLYNPIKNK